MKIDFEKRMQTRLFGLDHVFLAIKLYSFVGESFLSRSENWIKVFDEQYMYILAEVSQLVEILFFEHRNAKMRSMFEEVVRNFK